MPQASASRRGAPHPPRRVNPRGEGSRLRGELIDAGYALLAETGHAGQLSIRAVAARAGVAATSVYLHFADLEALKVAVAERGFADLATARAEAIAGIEEPAANLIARCLAYVDFALAHPGQYRLMFGPDLPPGAFTGSYNAANSASRSAYESLIDAIRDCQHSGAAAADTDPTRLAALLWPALHGQVTLRLDRPHFPRPPLHEVITETVQRLISLRPDTHPIPRA
ncbi:MAG: TetR-like C-terminal domain-containing protein [Allobranchiibius sp.]